MSEQSVYNALRASGLSRWGTLAAMGNFRDESNNESVRVEGDFSDNRSASKAYMLNVDSGTMSKQTFCFDARGWGLAQWTFWSRKEGLYDLCKTMGVSIGSEKAQAEWFIRELKTGYISLYNLLQQAKEADLYTAVYRMCVEYERPYINNVQQRYNSAVEISKRVKDEQPSPEPTPEPPKEVYWPPRMVDKSMTGPDVFALQGILCARGYFKGTMSGRFDDTLESAVKSFQRDSGLVADGVVGPKTWAELCKL